MLRDADVVAKPDIILQATCKLANADSASVHPLLTAPTPSKEIIALKVAAR